MTDQLVKITTRRCKNCDREFSFPLSGRGLAKVHCSKECQVSHGVKVRKTTVRPVCKADGCPKPATRVGAGLCETHYYRIRRNGQVDLPARDIPQLTDHSGGYRLKYQPNHPLGRNRSRVYEHRSVYHAEHGEGPFKCYHCGDVVTWDDMHVDHLNDQPDDNRIDNLVASCPCCNMKRGAWKMKITKRQNSVRQITWRGETRCASEWAELLGLRVASFQWRLEHWPLERVMTEPRGPTGPHRRDILAA